MSDNNHRSHKRQIDIHREELATYTEQFLARGGKVVVLPLNASKPALLAPPTHINLRKSVRSTARKREELSLKIVDLRRAGKDAADIARQLGVGRSVVTRHLIERGLA